MGSMGCQEGGNRQGGNMGIRDTGEGRMGKGENISKREHGKGNTRRETGRHEVQEGELAAGEHEKRNIGKEVGERG